ncbi:hypothetical protein D3C87_1431610 [compost metagenome]
MPGHAGDAECQHPEPVVGCDRLPVERPDERDRNGSRNAGVKEAGLGGVGSADHAGQNRIERKHQGTGDRHDDAGAKACMQRIDDQKNSDEADADGSPAPPSDGLTEQRHRKAGDHQWCGREDRVSLGKTDIGEGIDRHDDLEDQKRTADDLQHQPAALGCLLDATLVAGRERQHEGGEEPIADHRHKDGWIGLAKMFGNTILNREDRNRGQCEKQALGAWCHEINALERFPVRKRPGSTMTTQGPNLDF